MGIDRRGASLLWGTFVALFGAAVHGCGAPDMELGGDGAPTSDLASEGAEPVADAEQAIGVYPPPPQPKRRLQLDPPVIQRLLVKPLVGDARGNALVMAQMAKGEKLPLTIPIELDGKKITLRDDGKAGDARRDGVFSAIAKLDPKVLAQHREDLATTLKLQGDAQRPSFQGRALVERPLGEGRLKELEATRLKKLIDIVRPPLPPVFVDEPRSLMITDLSVVEDGDRTFNPCREAGTPMGKWTFGRLMTEMANEPVTGVRPVDLVTRWLDHWLSDQTVNGWDVPMRSAMQGIIDAWPRDAFGDLDLARAPFRLLAIVNRVDLRENLVYGGGSAGEGRFVFGVLGEECTPLPFTVIFEYGVQARGCSGARAWARAWSDLSTLPIGSPAYLSALEALTDKFSLANAAPSKPNGSALNQLRTNEIALSDPWELREFQIARSGPDASRLVQVTVKQTPDNTFAATGLNNTLLLADFILANRPSILVQKHSVPDEFPPGTHFLGGAAATPFAMFWQAPGITDYPARREFSLSTCNGCHAGETETTFLHVAPADFGSEAGLSGFLTGVDVEDPAGTLKPDGTPNETHFADLARRREDLADLAGSSCLLEILRLPLRMSH